MTQTLKQRRRQNFTRKQKGGGFFDFLKINVPVGEKVKGFFSGLKARFTRKKTFTEKVKDNVASGVKTVAAAPKQVVTGVSAGVKNMAAAPKKLVSKIPGVAPKPKTVFGGTRKRKQRKN
jgi:hypothetical protein|tara:strand:+ start:4264 stop:4623 length:360 start_codon:yes stop_codon:yes gene_type:complete